MFTKLKNPIGEIIILLIHKIVTNCGKLLLFLQILFKKLIPTEIAVVKIAIKIINPYIYLNSVNLLCIAYTTGISIVPKFISTFTNNKNVNIEIILIITPVIIDIITICLLLFINFLRFINTGNTKIKL